MKKSFIPIALITVLATSAVGCQKETIVETTPNLAEIGNVRTVRYTVDGVEHYIKLYGDSEWRLFIDSMMVLSNQGHEITIADANSVQIGDAAKETLTYTTKEQEEASNWAAERVGEGYTVRIIFDEETGFYTCIATR